MVDDELGPVDYLAVEFPAGRLTSNEFELLLDAVTRKSIRVLDLEFVAKGDDGAVSVVDLRELDPPDDVNPDIWDGATTKLLDETDVAEIGSAMRPGHVAGVVIYENLWTLSLAHDLSRHGVRLILDGRIGPDELVAALDLTEPTQPSPAVSEGETDGSSS